ncbi:MAG: hypothetical protein ACREF4_05735 [Gammaproteobacteria bacterium]
MNTQPSLADNETIIEYFSSHVARTAKRRKTIRRRIILLLIAAPKILGLLYFGQAGLTAAAAATDGLFGVKAATALHR